MGMNCSAPILFAVPNLDPSLPMGDAVFTEDSCVMPDGPDNKWGYCEKMTAWTKYTPQIVKVAP